MDAGYRAGGGASKGNRPGALGTSACIFIRFPPAARELQWSKDHEVREKLRVGAQFASCSCWASTPTSEQF